MRFWSKKEQEKKHKSTRRKKRPEQKKRNHRSSQPNQNRPHNTTTQTGATPQIYINTTTRRRDVQVATKRKQNFQDTMLAVQNTRQRCAASRRQPAPPPGPALLPRRSPPQPNSTQCPPPAGSTCRLQNSAIQKRALRRRRVCFFSSFVRCARCVPVLLLTPAPGAGRTAGRRAQPATGQQRPLWVWPARLRRTPATGAGTRHGSGSQYLRKSITSRSKAPSLSRYMLCPALATVRNRYSPGVLGPACARRRSSSIAARPHARYMKSCSP